MDISKHLDKAAEAVRKKNFDYAINLYHQVLLLKPDHGDARRDLRQALVRRSEYKKVPPLIAFLQGAPHRLGMLFGGLFKKPDQVAQAAESYLKNAPHNRSVNRALADALEKAGHPQSAVVVWEFLGQDEVVGDEALKRAGALYYSLKQMEKALGCYEAVLERSPRDSEAEKMRKNLAAEGVLSSGSYDPSKSSRELARNQDRKRELEVEQKIVTTEDERVLLQRSLEEKLAENTGDKRARRALVEHHVKGRDYAAAIAALEQGLELAPDSYELRERLGDVRILDLEHQIREVRGAAEKGDEAARTDLVDLTREKQEFELEEFSRRVKQHPTDLDLRYRLGRLLLEAEQIDPAIEHLQHSIKDPRRRVDSLCGLGQAFQSKGMTDLARKQYESALEGLEPSSDRAIEITYALAVLQEQSGDLQGARSRYESIFEKDIQYKDVAARLEGLRKKAGPGPKPEPEATPSSESPATDATNASGQDGKKDETSSSSIYDFQD